MRFIYFLEAQGQPDAQPLQLPPHVFADGQPIHFTPLFFAL